MVDVYIFKRLKYKTLISTSGDYLQDFRKSLSPEQGIVVTSHTNSELYCKTSCMWVYAIPELFTLAIYLSNCPIV